MSVKLNETAYEYAQEAGQYKHNDIESAAAHLHGMLDALA